MAIDGLSATETAILSQTMATVPYSLRETATTSPITPPTDTPGDAVRNGAPFGVVAGCVLATLMLQNSLLGFMFTGLS